jgi:toxin-antitoxin system PIN domain toxin
LRIPLLDVNLLVALAWPNHVHHRPAREWFRSRRGAGWATCSATQAGFVRVSSNGRMIPSAVTPGEAFALLSRMTALPGHSFWIDDVDLSTTGLISRDTLVGSQQVTDAHLLAVALSRGGVLATFDRGILAIVPPGVAQAEAVEVMVSATSKTTE